MRSAFVGLASMNSRFLASSNGGMPSTAWRIPVWRVCGLDFSMRAGRPGKPVADISGKGGRLR